MKALLRSKWGKAGLALIVLNEIRGVAVVASIVTAYFGISLPGVN